MKAIRVREFGDPFVMKLEDIQDLEPNKNQVVVELKGIGVNPVDAYCRSGSADWISIPFTPGIDGSGIIKKVGLEVQNIKKGDRVYLMFNISGTYAEEVLCDATQVYPLPDNVNFEEGAGIFIPYGTAYRGLFERCNIEAGETVLIHGASGAVGIAAIQFAVAAGCTVIGTAGTDQGRDLVYTQGAHFVVNHHNQDHYHEILEITKKIGVNVIIELASANIKKDISILTKKGRIAVIGDRDPIEIDAHALTSCDGSILGTNIGNINQASMKKLHAVLYVGLKKNILKPHISQKFPLINAYKAHEILGKTGSIGKIILIP